MMYIISKLKSLRLLGFLGWLLHPIIVPFYTVKSWVLSLWASRILFYGRWASYHGFHAQNAINSLFYRTQWININRYGRAAYSPIIGIGNYPIYNWWHLSSIASYMYAYAGAVITIVGSIIMISSHFVWLYVVPWNWLLSVIVILIFSSTIIMTTFHSQNYQILSWMWLPVILYTMCNGDLIAATLLLSAAGIFGITVIILTAPLVICQTILMEDFRVLLILLPALLIKSINFIPVFINARIKESIGVVGKMVGFVHTDVKYKRKSMGLSIHHLYMLLLYSVAIICFLIAYKEIPYFIFIAYLIFLCNQLFIRFADDQSVMLFFILVTTFELVTHQPNIIAGLGLMIVANPRPSYLAIGHKNRVRVYKPFDVDPILENLNQFLKVPEHSRVLFAFNDPQGEYEKIFDGYRIMLEAPLVVASDRKVHLFPDWWAVAQTNYKGSPTIWGRSKNEVIRNMEYWHADFVIVYQDSKSQLDEIWKEHFIVVSEFDWGETYHEFVSWELISSNLAPPKWWLLKRNL